MVWPVKKTKRLARSVSNAFIEGISLSVAFHGAKAAAWVDMVIGIVVDHDTYIGVFTAVAKIREALSCLSCRCVTPSLGL